MPAAVVPAVVEAAVVFADVEAAVVELLLYSLK